MVESLFIPWSETPGTPYTSCRCAVHKTSEYHPAAAERPKRDERKKKRRKTMTTHRTNANPHFVPGFLGRVSDRVTSYVSRSRAERQLEALDDRLLADIGISRSQIHRMVWGA